MNNTQTQEIELIGYEPKSSVEVPFYMMSVAAGIPIPVESEIIETHLDMNEFLVERPNATFFAKMNGDSPFVTDIKDGDILVVDSSIEPKDGDLAVVDLNNNLTIRYHRIVDEVAYLESDNSQFVPINLSELIDFKILGVVKKVVHSFN
jgi:DNA polymerase V